MAASQRPSKASERMSEEPRKGLFRRKPKDPNKKPGRLAQMRQVYELYAKHNKATPWLLAAAVLGCTILGVGAGFVFGGRLVPAIIRRSASCVRGHIQLP